MKPFLFVALLASIALGQWSVELVPYIFYSADDTLIWDDIYYFGTNPSATDGYDAGIDVAVPPFPPTGPFFYFVIDDYPANHLHEDYRSTSDDTIIWTVVFGSMGSPVPESLWFTWDTTAIPPAGDYRIDVIDLSRGGHLYKDLRSISWDDAVDMSSERKIPYYAENYLIDVVAIRQVLTTGIDEYTTSSRPSTPTLSAYPNPFNSACRISAPENAVIEIFDINGRCVAEFDGGDQIWKPEASVGSGIYLVRATIPEQTTSVVCTKRVVYLK